MIKFHEDHKALIGLIIGVLLFAGVITGILIMKNNIQGPETIGTVRLETTNGEILITLDDEMPKTSENFKKLVTEGFYDGTIFHRVIEGFMIQGGDPKGTGSGGPGYTINDEFTGTDKDRNDRGTISMANAGPNTGGSQYFINLVNNNFLDGRHPVFVKVVEGMDIVDAIGKVETNNDDRPLVEVRIIKATMI